MQFMVVSKTTVMHHAAYQQTEFCILIVISMLPFLFTSQIKSKYNKKAKAH